MCKMPSSGGIDCGSQHSLSYNGTIGHVKKKKKKENSITNALLVK